MSTVPHVGLFPKFSVTAWLLRIVGAAPPGFSRAVVASALFTVAFGAWAYAISVRSSRPLLTWSSGLGFSWLCLAPLIIWWGYLALCQLLDHSRDITKPSDDTKLTSTMIRLFLGWRHMWLSMTLGPIVGIVAWQYATAVGRTPLQCYWYGCTFGVLGFVSGIGFWAIICTARLVATLCSLAGSVLIPIVIFTLDMVLRHGR